MKETLIQRMIRQAIVAVHESTGAKGTKAALARALGIDRSQVTKWARGETSPAVTTLHRLSRLAELGKVVARDQAKWRSIYRQALDAPVVSDAGA